MSAPQQRVTSLRRRAQAKVPVASCWLLRVLATAGAEATQLLRARGTGGTACNARCLEVVTYELCYIHRVTVT